MTGADGPDCAENRCTSGNCGGMDGSSTDGLCFTKRVVCGWPVVVCGWPVVVHGWPMFPKGSSADGQWFPRSVVYGWPQGRLRITTGSSTDGPRFSVQAVHGWRESRLEAGRRRCTTVHQNGSEGRLLQVVYGWPTGRPRMAQPVHVAWLCKLYRFRMCRVWRTQSRFHGFQIVEKSLNSKTLRGAQTSESLGTAPVRWEVVEIRAPLPAESAHPDVRHGTRLGSSYSCCGTGTTRSRCGVWDACIRGHLSRCRVRDSSTHCCLRSSSYHNHQWRQQCFQLRQCHSQGKLCRSSWRFHRCRSWTKLLTCPLLFNDRCPWS